MHHKKKKTVGATTITKKKTADATMSARSLEQPTMRATESKRTLNPSDTAIVNLAKLNQALTQRVQELQTMGEDFERKFTASFAQEQALRQQMQELQQREQALQQQMQLERDQAMEALTQTRLELSRLSSATAGAKRRRPSSGESYYYQASPPRKRPTTTEYKQEEQPDEKEQEEIIRYAVQQFIETDLEPFYRNLLRDPLEKDAFLRFFSLVVSPSEQANRVQCSANDPNRWTDFVATHVPRRIQAEFRAVLQSLVQLPASYELCAALTQWADTHLIENARTPEIFIQRYLEPFYRDVLKTDADRRTFLRFFRLMVDPERDINKPNCSANDIRRYQEFLDDPNRIYHNVLAYARAQFDQVLQQLAQIPPSYQLCNDLNLWVNGKLNLAKPVTKAE